LRAVAKLGGDPRSVADVVALLSLPLGIARGASLRETPDTVLMERVSSGLRRL
jgi:hypothetical protein